MKKIITLFAMSLLMLFAGQKTSTAQQNSIYQDCEDDTLYDFGNSSITVSTGQYCFNAVSEKTYPISLPKELWGIDNDQWKQMRNGWLSVPTYKERDWYFFPRVWFRPYHLQITDTFDLQTSYDEVSIIWTLALNFIVFMCFATILFLIYIILDKEIGDKTGVLKAWILGWAVVTLLLCTDSQREILWAELHSLHSWLTLSSLLFIIIIIFLAKRKYKKVKDYQKARPFGYGY